MSPEINDHKYTEFELRRGKCGTIYFELSKHQTARTRRRLKEKEYHAKQLIKKQDRIKKEIVK